MRAPIFFDQTHSYHPLEKVTEILKKSIHPHALSAMQSKETCLKQQAWLEKIRDDLGVDSKSSFCLTKGGKEAIHQMLDHFYFQEMFHSGKQHVAVVSSDEELLGDRLSNLKMLGVIGQSITVDSKGHITKEILQGALTPRTALLSFSWANSLTGVIQPVADIVETCHVRGVACHVDVSHVIGKLYFNLADVKADYVTFDAKAFHGPYCLGGLITRNKTNEDHSMLPLHLEALEVALTDAHSHIDEIHLEVARLRQSFERQLIEQIPQARVLLQDIERLPHISVISFPYIHNEYLLYLLRKKQLYASIGDENQLLTHILLSMQVESVFAQCALSFSFSYKTTQEEINEAVEVIVKCYNKAQKLAEKVYS